MASINIFFSFIPQVPSAVSFHSFAVRITSCADTSVDNYLGSFFQIDFCKLCILSERHAGKKSASLSRSFPYLRSTANVYRAIAVLLSSCKYLISGAFVSRPIKITLFISSSSFFCSDLLVPYESGLDSIESAKTIYYHCIRLSFLRPHITKRSEGKIQWANAKNFIFLFLSLTYTKEERCFYRVLEKFFYFCAKK